MPGSSDATCGHWMRRQGAHCARQPHSTGQHSVRPDPDRVMVAADNLCGIWISPARTFCARRPNHKGKDHRTAEAMADKRPRKTTRRRGVRQKPDAETRHRWYRAYKFKRLGISEEEFERRLEEQGYCCAFCHLPFEDGQRVVADHDHTCCPLQPDRIAKTCGKCIRGLLHWGCNTRVGYVERYRTQVDEYLAWSAARATVGRTGLEPVTPTV